MDRHQDGAQVGCSQHHHGAARTRLRRPGGQVCDELGMPRKAEAGLVQGGLGDWGGDQSPDRAGQAQADTGLDPADDGVRVVNTGMTCDHGRAQV